MKAYRGGGSGGISPHILDLVSNGGECYCKGIPVTKPTKVKFSLYLDTRRR
jgi:hypothetical protein